MNDSAPALSLRAPSDIEILAVGVSSPLERVMGKADYQRILEQMCGGDGRVAAAPELRLTTIDWSPADYATKIIRYSEGRGRRLVSGMGTSKETR